MVFIPRSLSAILTRLTFILIIPGLVFAGLPYLSARPGVLYLPEYGLFASADTTQTLSLSGTWELNDGSDDWREVQVPGCWPADRGDIVLRRSFTMPEAWEFNHHQLVFWGVRPNAAITLNGRLLKTSEGDWPQVVINLPMDAIRYDRPNQIRVELDDRLSARETIPLKPKLYDPQSWSGIFADVQLVSGPQVTIEDVAWTAAVTSDGAGADWSLEIELRDHGGFGTDSLSTRSLEVGVDWIAPGDSIRGSGPSTHLQINTLEKQTVHFTGVIRNPKLWSPSQPRLYTALIVVAEGGRKFTVPVKLGIRTLRWENGQAYLNGDPLEIRGIDYRQESASSGGAISPREIEADLTAIRNQGFNLIRVIGAVPRPMTFEACDRLGLLLLPTTGLRGVPADLMTDPMFKVRLESMLRLGLRGYDHHASVVGWELEDWAPQDAALIREAGEIRARLMPGGDQPLFIGFARDAATDLPDGIVGVRERAPYQFEERVNPQDKPHGTWLVGGLGALATPLQLEEDSLQSEIRQSDALVRQVNAVREMPVAGFIVDGYNDRRAALPMLIAGAQRDPSVIRRGLMTENRKERIAWQRVGDQLGQVRIDVPVVHVDTGQFPVQFPLATLIVGGLLLLAMRQNNVFRHNLRRVFAHTHGFFVDIVDRRYFQNGQTLFIALIFAGGQAILLASLLNHSRFDFGLDYLYTLLIPFPEAKALLVYWAWHPIQAMLAFMMIVLILLVLLAGILRLISISSPGQMKFRHSIALVFWAATCFLPLIPLGLIYYRLLDFGWFEWLQTLLFVLFWYWFLTRLSSVIRVGFRISPRSAWILMLLLLVAGAGTLLTLYRGGFAIMDYVRYYYQVVVPWTSGSV